MSSPIFCACALPHTPEEEAKIAAEAFSSPSSLRGESVGKNGRFWWFRHHSAAFAFALRIGKSPSEIKAGPRRWNNGNPYSWRVYR